LPIMSKETEQKRVSGGRGGREGGREGGRGEWRMRVEREG